MLAQKEMDGIYRPWNRIVIKLQKLENLLKKVNEPKGKNHDWYLQKWTRVVYLQAQ